MKIYTEDKLRIKLSVLRMGKAMNQLNDDGEIELITCELLLEQFCINKLKDKEIMINDKKCMQASIINSYNVIVGKQTVEEIINSIKYPMFLFNPEDDYTNSNIEEMINYFIDTEEYEICSKLQKLLK